LKKDSKYSEYEALGFIRGIVCNTGARKLESLIPMNNKDFLDNIESDMVQAILIMVIQLEANGISIEEIIAKDSDRIGPGSAEAVLEELKFKFNEQKDRILLENETRIDLSDKAAQAIDFSGIPDILMDIYRPKGEVERGAEVSMTVVMRSILSAA
ncbi:MAG: hypothetical protein II816_07035, partial [Elusimicrobia bacterium]|nr:hypothetical protein [Elusimicrobiota bacterium]